MFQNAHKSPNRKIRPPRVLMYVNEPDLGRLWRRHLERQGIMVSVVATQAQATKFLADFPVDVLILDLVLDEGAALAVSDYANFRQPDTQVIFVTNASFFSDGSIFALCSNARAVVSSTTAPEDLAAMVDHYGTLRA